MRWVVALLGGLAGLLLLVAAATVFLGQAVLDDRLEQLGQRTGLSIEVEGVSVDLAAGLRLDGVSVRGPGELAGWQVTIEHLVTDLDLSSLLRGARRPGRVWVRGAEVSGRVDRGTLRAARELLNDRQPTRSEDGPAASASLPVVSIEGASGVVDIALALQGVPTPQRVLFSDWSAEVTWRDGTLLRAAGQLAVAGALRRVEIEATGGRDGDVSVRLDGPLGFALTAHGRHVQVQADGLERKDGRISATGLVLQLEQGGAGERTDRGRLIAACDRLEPRLAAGAAEGRWLEATICEGLRAGVGSRRAESRRATVDFHVEDTAPEATDAWPRPRRAQLEGLRLRGTASDRAEATAQRLAVLFEDEALLAAAEGRWAEAIRAVTLRGPALHLTVPDLDAPLDPLKSAAADIVPDDPEAGPPDDELEPDRPGAGDTSEAIREDGEQEDPGGQESKRSRRRGHEGGGAVAPIDLPLPPTTAFRVPFGKQLVEYARKTRLTIERGRVEVAGADDNADRALVLDDLELVITPGERGGVTAAVHSLLQRGKVQSGRATVTAQIEADGSVHSARGVVAGTDFAHVLSRLSPYATVQPEAWVQVDFDYAFDPGEPPDAGQARDNGKKKKKKRKKRRKRGKRRRGAIDDSPPTGPSHRLNGQARFEDFGLEAWRISHTPMTGLEGRVDYELTIHPADHHVRLGLPKVVLGETTLSASLAVTAAPDDGPILDARAEMPLQDCAAMARSIPRALIPRLEGIELKGALAWEASLQVDTDRPYDLELHVEGDVDNCRVVTLGDQIDLEALRGPFIHHPIEPKLGVREDIEVGRGSTSWVPGNQLPRFVKAAAIVTEDRSYYAHAGVRWDLVERALKLNIEKGRFVYGGSTITQQLVKNLYLTREKTLSRKLEELFIVWEMERRFTKEEILELYVNVIEYGPDLYGVRRAAHYYFGKPPGALSPSEASFIMGLKPYPGAGHRQWQSQKLNRWWVSRVEHVLGMIHRREGAISQAEVLAGGAKTIRFRSPGGSLWGGARYVRPRAEPPPPTGTPHVPPVP